MKWEKYTQEQRDRYKAQKRKKYAENAEFRERTLTRTKAYNKANPDRRRMWRRARYAADKAGHAAYMRDYRAKNPPRQLTETQRQRANAAGIAHYHATKHLTKEKRRANYIAWCAANPAKLAAYWAKRRAAELQRTPKWLTADDHWLIEQFYETAKQRSELTGVPHHVDHIVPLQGKLVSGLHVPKNLQVIPAKLNMVKRNKFVPA